MNYFGFLGVPISMESHFLFKFKLGISIIFVVLVFKKVKNSDAATKTNSTMFDIMRVYVLIGVILNYILV